MIDANKEPIEGLFRTINEHRIADLPDYLAPDVDDHNEVIHREADQPGAAFDAIAQRSAFDDARMDPQALIAEGDQVVVRLVAGGVHTGFHPRMPNPTGRRFEVEQIWIFTLADDKVSEIRAVSDRLGMFAQLGWDRPS
jgi:predicted ester cyclase